MNQGCCAVCDEVVLFGNIQAVRVSHSFATKCLDRLSPGTICPRSELPEVVLSYYDVSELIPSLRGCLLSKRSILSVQPSRVGEYFDVVKYVSGPYGEITLVPTRELLLNFPLPMGLLSGSYAMIGSSHADRIFSNFACFNFTANLRRSVEDKKLYGATS